MKQSDPLHCLRRRGAGGNRRLARCWLAKTSRLFGLSLLLSSGMLAVKADGIPEPSLVLYGVITDPSAGGTRVTYGNLTWVFQPSGGGSPITATAVVTNINDQFSYVVMIPCETQIGGLPVSAGSLQLAPAGTSYDRSQVKIQGVPASFVTPSQTNLTLSSTDRGRIERVDLTVSLGSSGLIPCAWQIQYFGYCGIDPYADPDHDGMNNYQEYLAGTNPMDAQSLFAILRVTPDPTGPFVVWSSVAGKSYSVQRSSFLMSGFTNVQTAIAATAPLNSFHDTSATGNGPFFYRIHVQ